MSTSGVRRVFPPCVGVTILRGGAGEASQSEAFILSIDQSEASLVIRCFQDTSGDWDRGGGDNSVSEGEIKHVKNKMLNFPMF